MPQQRYTDIGWARHGICFASQDVCLYAFDNVMGNCIIDLSLWDERLDPNIEIYYCEFQYVEKSDGPQLSWIYNITRIE